jgi:hypothetical protein
MRTALSLVALLAVATSAYVQAQQPAATASQPAKRRGSAVAENARPAHFPHRIWAFSGFEAKPPTFGWFGAEEKQNIPAYPGNTAARRGTGPHGKHAALMTGMNPVPGPCMGQLNCMYCRYYLKGTDRATFQHFSLSSSDNCNIRVSGLKQGQWSELTLNFTRDSRRNDGSPGAFKPGERMDDLKVFVGTPGDGQSYEMIIDDVIFFDANPALPDEEVSKRETSRLERQPEPFPNRVIFLAAFDTGIRPESGRAKYYPGEWAIAEAPPAGSYWSVAQAVPAAGGKESHVLLKFPPPRPLGSQTKLRFRYWLRGADSMKLILHNATANADHAVQLKELKQGQWVTQYVDFSKQAAGRKPKLRDLADQLRFVVPGSGQNVRLYVDEVVLFEPAPPPARPAQK